MRSTKNHPTINILDMAVIENDLERKIREVAKALPNKPTKAITRPTVIKEQSPSRGQAAKMAPQQPPPEL
jgi:hypothetical protein